MGGCGVITKRGAEDPKVGPPKGPLPARILLDRSRDCISIAQFNINFKDGSEYRSS